MKIIPFERSYWIIPGKLMAGKYPASREKAKSMIKLDSLLDAGIKTIIDLTEKDETNIYNDPLFHYSDYFYGIAGQRNINVDHLRFEIPDLQIPTNEVVKEIIEVIDNSIEKNNPVYVHCRGGVGRTGTIIGCYLIEKGMADKSNVFDTIAYLKRTTDVHDIDSPETDIQKKFVLNWK